jgi:aspartate kinase
MSLIVQKFGGTSVADGEKILAAARKAIRAQQQGHEVVMVVSAMGKNTDLLVDLAHQINETPPAREMDMLLSTGEQVSVALMAMAIDSLGAQAVSLTGAQIGIRTDSTHTKARIHSISTERLRSHLAAGKIVIAAGFQGIDEEFNITTLGRGGSDTTAVALAAVLKADACEIYTDVDGVYTTDPRLIPEARRVAQVSYDEMLELASLGAGVMHSRSVEFAKKFGVPIHVRSSFTDTPGTMIVSEPEVATRAVSGAAITRSEARITVRGIPDVPGSIFEILSPIAQANVTVDMIVQNVADEGRADISFTVPRDELNLTLKAVRDAQTILGDVDVSYDDQVAKVSVVGKGMATQFGVADRMFAALAQEGINIQMISTSEIKISTLVAREQSIAALRAIHRAFELEKPEETVCPSTVRQAPEGPQPIRFSPRTTADVIQQLQGMEELTIDDVVLDTTQGRVTIFGVPDTPGVAQEVFQRIGDAGIFVDMIVQSYPIDGTANLSFTVSRKDLARSVDVAEHLTSRFPSLRVSSSGNVAKLSVSGIGLRSHTGVAIRMFRALAEAEINVGMINTSEVRVNVVVDGSDGERGLACLKQAFADVI